MKLDDKVTQSVAATVSDVLEGKVKKEEVKYPHMMYSKDGKDEVEVKDKAEHDKFAAKGYVHEKPKMESPEEPRAKGEKEFKAKHTVKKSGEKEDGTVVKEAKSKFSKSLLKKASDIALSMGGNMTGAVKKIEKLKKGLSDDPEVKAALQLANEEFEANEVQEMSKKEKYQKVFQAALKKFGVKSPGELEGDKKKEFFDYVDAQYDAGENETDVDENLLGTIKKAVGKVTGKKPERKNDGSDDPAQKVQDEIDKLLLKIKKYEKQEREADNDDSADYYLELQNKAHDKIHDLKQKLKKAQG